MRIGPRTQRVAGWVHAYRLSEEQANKARALCRQRNSKKGHTPQARTLFLAGWVLVWTSLPPAVLSADTVLALYRVRWQVELAIKRCKSLLDADALRARQGSPLADLWLHGKMLYALLVDKRMRRTMGVRWGHLDHQRTATWWRPWKLMQQTLMPRADRCLALARAGLERQRDGVGRAAPTPHLAAAARGTLCRALPWRHGSRPAGGGAGRTR